jgi:GT2 family glycosyltransferase
MSGAARIQAVVVLYRRAPRDSAALQGLLAALRKDPDCGINLLVYDNSPESSEAQVTRPRPGAPMYVHDPENGGLLAAYRKALAEAIRNRAEWLLLLDHDTEVTAEFVQAQLKTAAELKDARVGAVVPQLRSAGTVQSPHGVVGPQQEPLPENFSGLAPLGTTAFNSGAMLRVSAVAAVGGFPDGYRVDFLDHAMFARLARGGFRVLVLPCTMEHSMTWEDPAKEMSIERFAGVLEAEQRFHREYGDWRGGLAFRLRCLRRGWNYRGWTDKRYCWACLRAAVS